MQGAQQSRSRGARGLRRGLAALLQFLERPGANPRVQLSSRGAGLICRPELQREVCRRAGLSAEQRREFMAPQARCAHDREGPPQGALDAHGGSRKRLELRPRARAPVLASACGTSHVCGGETRKRQKVRHCGRAPYLPNARARCNLNGEVCFVSSPSL